MSTTADCRVVGRTVSPSADTRYTLVAVIELGIYDSLTECPMRKRNSIDKSVAIIGGGVAGIAAALPLADAGFAVQLFEKRALLGGRASSFCDHQTGERVDE